MKHDELIEALRRLKVETGSLACLGCGHEHNCNTQGCAILREAVAALEIDAVPVVRCGKCSDWERGYRRREPTKMGYCRRRNCWMFEQEFCSSGRPRDEKET